VALKDFRMTLSSSKVVAGPTQIEIDNSGPTMHEAVFKRSAVAADKLPLASNGIRLNEDSSLLTGVLDAGSVDLGGHVRRVVTFAPGHYVVFCNLPGHFQAGMHAEFDVPPGGAQS
jgi:uncharacterized cupredoxin-like copper-binding protein